MRPAFLCSLSGVKINSLPGYFLRINSVDSPISYSSYLAISREAHELGLSGNKSETQNVLVVSKLEGEETPEFWVNLKGLRNVSDWRTRIDNMFLNAERQSDIPQSATPAESADLHPVRSSQPEFSFA